MGVSLSKAKERANYIVKELEPFCDKIEVVGSVRREKDEVKDIDILLAPKTLTLFEMMNHMVKLGASNSKIESKKTLWSGGCNVELWITSLDRWPVMLLIRTGGEKSNKRIAELCKQKKWHLSVSEGAILDENGKKFPVNSEEDVYKLLGINYLEPKERE